MKLTFYYWFLILLSCLSIALVLFNLRLVLDDFSITGNSAFVKADVTNWRVHDKRIQGGYTTSRLYEIQYRFSLPDDTEQYSYSETASTRKNLWAELPKTHWLETKRTKKVPVHYNVDNPWKNKISSELTGSTNTIDNMIGLIMSIVIMIIVISSTFLLKQGLRRKIDSAER